MLLCLMLFLTLFSSAEALVASAKAMGMAGAVIAYPLDSLSGAYNPANMVLIGDRIDLGASGVHDNGKISVSKSLVPRADGDFNCTTYRNFLLGSFGINKVWADDCFLWSFGLMTYANDFHKTRFDRPFPLFGRTKPGLEYISYAIAPVLAMEVGGSQAFGVAFDWELQSLKVTGLEHLARHSRHRHHVTNKGRGFSHGASATLGWRWKVTNWLAVGASYRPKVHMKKFKKHHGFLGGKLDLPEKYGVGLQIQPLQSLVICADVEWIDWQNIASLNNKLLNERHLRHFGAKDGPGFGYKNQTIYRLGIEFQLTEAWTIRAGYRHASTPIKRSETLLNALMIDAVENYITAGTSYLWDCCGEMSAFIAHGFKHKISGEHAIPREHFRGGHLAIEESKTIVGLAYAWFY